MEKINSVAAVLRLPKGTKLRIIRSMLGPCPPTGRIVKEVHSRDVVMTVDDPTSNSKESWLYLKGAKVEARPNGFVVMHDGEVSTEYEFAPAGSDA